MLAHAHTDATGAQDATTPITLLFQCGDDTSHEHVIPFSVQKVILRSIVLAADPSYGQVVLDGQHNGRLFDVNGSRLEVRNVALRNGMVGDDGGCIRSNSGAEIVVSNVTFANCHAGGAGGAVHTTGMLSIVRGSLVNNTALHGGAVSVIGSNVAGDGDCHTTFTDTVIKGNKAESGGGGIHWKCPKAQRTLTMTRCEVLGNSCTGDGGGLFVEGDQSAKVSITGSLFYQNKALASLEGGGGGIKFGHTQSVRISDTYFVENGAQGNGGAIRLLQSALTATDVIFSGNYANSHKADAKGWPDGGVGGTILWDHAYNYKTSNPGEFHAKRVVIENSVSQESGAITFGLAPVVTMEDTRFCQNRGSARSGMYRATSLVMHLDSSHTLTCSLGNVSFGGDTFPGWPANKHKIISFEEEADKCSHPGTTIPQAGHPGTCSSLVCDGSNARCRPAGSPTPPAPSPPSPPAPSPTPSPVPPPPSPSPPSPTPSECGSCHVCYSPKKRHCKTGKAAINTKSECESKGLLWCGPSVVFV
jgi:hypothetical protein